MGTEQASGTGLGTHSSIATCSQIQPAHAGCDRGDNTLRHPLQLETCPDWRRVSHPPPSCAAGAPGGVTSCGRQSPGRAQHVPSPGVRENAVPAYPLGPQEETDQNGTSPSLTTRSAKHLKYKTREWQVCAGGGNDMPSSIPAATPPATRAQPSPLRLAHPDPHQHGLAHQRPT